MTLHSFFRCRIFVTALCMLALIGGGLMLPASAHALLRVDITQGQFKPLPIALAMPSYDTEEGKAQGQKVRQVIEADLERSGLFQPIDPLAFVEQITSEDQMPNLRAWQTINAQGLVTSHVTVSGDQVRIRFRLWDVLAGKQVAGKELTTELANWRRLSHLVADAIYERLTGERGYFDTRIVYVAESGPRQKRVKRLAIMDQDGANHLYLTSGRELVLTPRFSPGRQEILYLSYERQVPQVFIRDLQTGRQRILGSFDGMTFAPRFHPDGRYVVMSVESGGNSEIYLVDLVSRRKKKLTDNPAIDTSPSFSPDGQQIVFESDRGGSQQLYIMDINGNNVRRISFGKGRYGTPVWSPRGDMIAFTKMSGGQFYIGLMRTDGSGERAITSGYLVEGPTWSPNGRVIMFTRQERGRDPKLYSIDVTGYNEREVPTPSAASDPAWSPWLPM